MCRGKQLRSTGWHRSSFLHACPMDGPHQMSPPGIWGGKPSAGSINLCCAASCGSVGAEAPLSLRTRHLSFGRQRERGQRFPLLSPPAHPASGRVFQSLLKSPRVALPTHCSMLKFSVPPAKAVSLCKKHLEIHLAKEKKQDRA